MCWVTSHCDKISTNAVIDLLSPQRIQKNNKSKNLKNNNKSK